MRLTISKSLLNSAAEFARQCSSEATSERVLVSRAAALAVREYLREVGGIDSEEGRSGSLKYVELLDICDFKANGWSVEVRAMTSVGRVAQYVPTMPLMVGLISDFYVCTHLDAAVSRAQVLGYATRSDLAEAELSVNGLFAILPAEELRPFGMLPQDLREQPTFDPAVLRAYDEWRARAERIMRGVQDVLAAEGAFLPEHVTRLAGGLRDDILRVYGEHLPETGLEPLFDQLFRRFGIERPVPAPPDSPVAFSSQAEDVSEFAEARERDRFFRDDMGVSHRVSLYRYLLEDEQALEEHRRMKRVLDRATGGKHQSGPHRREQVRAASDRRVQSAWIEPPARESVGARGTRGSDGDTRMTRLEDLKRGASVKGVLPDGMVTVVDVKWYGSDVVELTYKDAAGHLGNELLLPRPRADD